MFVAVVHAVALVLAFTPPMPAGASSFCASDCGRRMTDCRAERCGGLAGKACRDTCRAVTGCAAGGPRIRTLATVVNECRVNGAVWTARQRLDGRVE